MTPKPTTEDLPVAAEKSAAPAEPTAEPTVQTVPKFEAGDNVRHPNGAEYIVRYQTAEGVALEGVANLVLPTVLKKI